MRPLIEELAASTLPSRPLGGNVKEAAFSARSQIGDTISSLCAPHARPCKLWLAARASQVHPPPGRRKARSCSPRARATGRNRPNGGSRRGIQDQGRRQSPREADERQALDRTIAAKRSDELNRFASEFEDAVGTIVASVAASASQLETSAGLLSQNAGSAQHLSRKTAGASEETSSEVRAIGSATEELSTSMNEIRRHVDDSNRIALEAVNQAERTNGRISRLSEAAERIGSSSAKSRTRPICSR